MVRSHRAVLVAVVVAALAAGSVSAAFAGPVAPSVVIRTGHCVGLSTWQLTLAKDAGRIESDLEVQSTRGLQTWHFVMKDNGIRFGHGNQTTKPGGAFTVTRFAANQLGIDHIVAHSTNLTTGEVCRASAKIK